MEKAREQDTQKAEAMGGSQVPIKIDLPDMASRVTHGFHLTNEEARWLLKQIGIDVPSRRRCNVCNAMVASWMIASCDACHGKGYLPAEEPEYEVVPMVSDGKLLRGNEWYRVSSMRSVGGSGRAVDHQKWFMGSAAADEYAAWLRDGRATDVKVVRYVEFQYHATASPSEDPAP